MVVKAARQPRECATNLSHSRHSFYKQHQPHTNMEPTDYQVIETMLRLGGGFVKRLAACFVAADPDNKERLKKAFRVEWQHYVNLWKWKNEKDDIEQPDSPVKPLNETSEVESNEPF